MKYLFLSPHPDDIELCCGATISRLATIGHDVTLAVFSDCDTEGIMSDVSQAHSALFATRTRYYYYPQRHFPQHRQAILESILDLSREVRPDVVFLPDPDSDIHQDHQVIGWEGLRVFKMTADIIGFSHSHNQVVNRNNYFISVVYADVENKLRAVSYYPTEQDRYYFQPDAIRSTMRFYGVQCESEYAEAFRIIRKVDRL